MARLILALGTAMIALGVIAYVLTSFASVTALIPAFIGLPIAACGALALNPDRAKPALIVAVLLALLGLGGTGSRLIPTIIDGSVVFDAVTIVQIIFTLLALDVVVLGMLALLRKKPAAA